MNLEMPSPAEADSLRTILLIVLGVMILTIPVVFVIVLSRLMAQRKQRPGGASRKPSGSSHDTGGSDPTMGAMGAGLFAAGAVNSGQDAPPPPLPHGVEQPPHHHHHHHGCGHEHQPPVGEPASGSHDNSPSWGGDSPAMDSGGGSFDSGGCGGGDSGGGGGC